MLSDSSDSSDSDTGRFKSGSSRTDHRKRSPNNNHTSNTRAHDDRRRRSPSRERQTDRKRSLSRERRDRNENRRRNHSRSRERERPHENRSVDSHRRVKRSRSRDRRPDNRSNENRNQNNSRPSSPRRESRQSSPRRDSRQASPRRESRQSSPRREMRRRSRSNDSGRQRAHIRDTDRHEPRNRDIVSNSESDNRRNEHVHSAPSKVDRHSRRNSSADEAEAHTVDKRRRHGDEREAQKEHKAEKSSDHRSKRSPQKSRNEEAPIGGVTVSPSPRNDDSDNAFLCGPSLPPHMQKPSQPEETFGPVLPPKCSPKRSPSPVPQRSRIVGPILPSHINLEEAGGSQTLSSHDEAVSDISEDDIDYDTVGPLPPGLSKSDAHLELERRALELKLAQLNDSDDDNANEPARDEWMTALPEVRKVGNMGLVARQFKTKVGPEIGDRSGWTDTPSDRERKAQKRGPTADELIAERQRDAEAMYRAKRDAEQEKAASKHKKKHKRDHSLMDLHQKKLKKEKKVSSSYARMHFVHSTIIMIFFSSICRKKKRSRRPAANRNGDHSVVRTI